MALIRFLPLWAGLALLPISVAAQSPYRVTQLEASHVAEIHTGAASNKIELQERQDGTPLYLVHSKKDGQSFEVQIHGVHGRLLKIETEAEDRTRRTVYEWPGVRVVAHRGGALLGPPENTIPAIERAIEIGADLIEVDIRQTSDGQFVLMHDVTVDRTTTGSGRVAELTLEELRKLEIRHPGSETIRVPTLAEALRSMQGRIDPDLDFKEGDLRPLLQEVRRFELEDFSTMHGTWDRCLQVVETEPAIRIRPTADYPQQVPNLIRQLRPAMVNLDWHAVTEEAVRLAHLGGCHAFVNCLSTSDTDFYIEKAIEIGADYIQSDRPDAVIRLLQQRGMRDSKPPRGDNLRTPLRGPQLAYPLR